MEGISKTALKGLQNAAARLNENAAKIASGKDIDAKSMIDIKQAENEFKANAKVLKVHDELTKTALDLMA